MSIRSGPYFYGHRTDQSLEAVPAWWGGSVGRLSRIVPPAVRRGKERVLAQHPTWKLHIVAVMFEYTLINWPPVASNATMTISATRARMSAYSTMPWPECRRVILPLIGLKA